MCLRKRWPRPLFSLAPAMRPGTSARTMRSYSSGYSMTPICGWRVVKGYAATFGRALVMRVVSEDLPALGKPTRPTSAMLFSSSRNSPISPGSPGPVLRGARVTDDLKRVLPKPPLPPLSSTNSSPSRRISMTFSPVSRRCTTVPSGTRRRAGRPSRPLQSAPWPCSPRSPFQWGLNLKSMRLFWSSSPRRITSPPLPPSPPLGPPHGSYFSRRKLEQPRPPSPARALMEVSSINMGI